MIWILTRIQCFADQLAAMLEWWIHSSSQSAVETLVQAPMLTSTTVQWGLRKWLEPREDSGGQWRPAGEWCGSWSVSLHSHPTGNGHQREGWHGTDVIPRRSLTVLNPCYPFLVLLVFWGFVLQGQCKVKKREMGCRKIIILVKGRGKQIAVVIM